MTVTYGRVPKPEMITAICEKPYDGAGYDSCPPRKIVGSVIHIWDGYLPGSTEAAKIQYAHDFFSTGGDRALDALADFVITKGGTIGMLNDPYGTRRPWCNGWGSEGPGLEGDGIAFVQKFGAYGTNYNLVGIEDEGKCGEELTPAQFEAHAQLTAWIFDQAKVSHESFPVNQNYGIVTNLWHNELAQKPCPCQAVMDQTPALQARVRAILKQYQTTGATTMQYPPGWDEALIKQLWPRFNPTGGVSKLWLKNWPLGPEVFHFKDDQTGREIFHFTSGIIQRLKTGDAWTVVKS